MSNASESLASASSDMQTPPSDHPSQSSPQVLALTEGEVVNTESKADPESSDNVEEVWTTLQFNWAGKPFTLDVAESDRVYDLKLAIQNLTNVPPERQKILGLTKGKLPPEQDTIKSLKLTSGKKFTLVGTALGNELKAPDSDFSLDASDDAATHDFELAASASDPYVRDRRNIRKIQDITKNLKVDLMSPLRPNKKLLVLDIDYTIVDTRPLMDGALPVQECVRPRLHEFLEAIYPYYDICVWSQTSWIWLETKLVEMEMVGTDRNYKISFVLDKNSMFQVFSRRGNETLKHSVKPLQIIWNTFPQFTNKNTIHIDDLGRNFALNPGEGLKISQFRHAHTEHAAADRELDDIARYMIHIAQFDDFTAVDHKVWRKALKKLRPVLQAQTGPSISAPPP